MVKSHFLNAWKYEKIRVRKWQIYTAWMRSTFLKSGLVVSRSAWLSSNTIPKRLPSTAWEVHRAHFSYDLIPFFWCYGWSFVWVWCLSRLCVFFLGNIAFATRGSASLQSYFCNCKFMALQQRSSRVFGGHKKGSITTLPLFYLRSSILEHLRPKFQVFSLSFQLI